MPRIGAEPERRKALIHAAIEMIGEHGSLDVSVKEIARQAGMSSALAFHYFGGKDEIIIETMRHLLRELSACDDRKHFGRQKRQWSALMQSFAPVLRRNNLNGTTIAAWLVFYLQGLFLASGRTPSGNLLQTV